MSFNGVGDLWIAPRATKIEDGWVFNGGEDRGAQYFSANPKTSRDELQMSNETKGRDEFGKVFYGFTVANLSDVWVNYDLQGGGFS